MNRLATSSAEPPARWRQSPWIHVLLIAVTFWAARHMLHAEFGFYEDDYTLVVRAMNADWIEVRDYLESVLLGFGGQGRPLQHSMVFLLSYASGMLGGLSAAYWLAYVIVAANAVLAYALLRKVVDGEFALLGGLVYALFSADTTQAFLYHAFGLQQALTFLLLALLAYVSRRRALSYVLILGALLSYETAYLVFLAAPLLEENWDRRWRGRLALHVVICLGLLAGMTVLRAALGEGRVLELAIQDLLQSSLLHSIQGPPVGLGSYVLRPVQALLGLNWRIGISTLTGSVVFLLVFRQHGSDELAKPRLLKLLVAGSVMLVLAYPLTFTIRAYAVSGRDTRVHLAAALGAALIVACLWTLVLAGVQRTTFRSIATAALAGWLGLMLGFGVLVQQDFARAWELQQRLWTSLLPAVPDLEDGDVLLVDPQGIIDTRYIHANVWNLPLVLQYLVDYPAAWEDPPTVHRLLPDWRERALTNPIELKVLNFEWEYVVTSWERTIILETEGGQVSGLLDTLELQDTRHRLRPRSNAVAGGIKPGPLYSELINGHNN